MKIYNIAQLEELTKTDIENIIKERGEILSKLISPVLKNKKLKPFTSKETNETNEKTFFTISEVELNDSKKNISYLDINQILLLNLNLTVKLNKKVASDLIYNKESGTSRMNKIIEEVIEKEARMLWSISEVKNNKIEINLLFSEKLILPDIVLFNEYKKVSKKAKKQDKENYKAEFENKLQLEIEELSKKRFNIIKNNPSYVPEDRLALMEFIKMSNKKFDQESLKNVIKKHSDDEEIVIESIGLFNDSLFPYISEKLKNDRNFILKLIDKNENILEHAPEQFRDDDEIMNKAIGMSGYIIRTASERIKNNKDFCLAAIKSQPEAYEVIPQVMREDNDLLMAAMNQRGEFLMYSSQVKTNKELLIKAFSNAFHLQSPNLLTLTSEELRNDKEVALAAIKCHAENIWNVSKELREEIGTQEPIEYLINYLLHEKLDNTTPEKSNKISKKKI